MKMGFKLEYLSDGTVKGLLNLKEESMNVPCPTPASPQVALQEKNKKAARSEAEVTTV
jgi:hypothetical protein